MYFFDVFSSVECVCVCVWAVGFVCWGSSRVQQLSSSALSTEELCSPAERPPRPADPGLLLWRKHICTGLLSQRASEDWDDPEIHLTNRLKLKRSFSEASWLTHCRTLQASSEAPEQHVSLKCFWVYTFSMSNYPKIKWCTHTSNSDSQILSLSIKLICFLSFQKGPMVFLVGCQQSYQLLLPHLKDNDHQKRRTMCLFHLLSNMVTGGDFWNSF